MAHKSKLTKAEWEALPEATRKFFTDEKLYVPDGENWKLDAEGIEDVGGLKSALQKERDAAEAARKELLKFKDVDPEKYKQFLSETETREADKLKKEGKWEEWKAAFEVQKKKDLDARDESIKELQGRIRKFMLEDNVKAAALKSGVVKDLIDDVVVVTANRFKLDANEKIQVIDKDGETPLDITVDSFFSDVFKSQRPQYYAGSGAGGSGAQNGTSGNGAGKKTVPRADWEKMSPQDSTKFFKDGGVVTD
jgi:hypothetical protein